MTCPNCSAIFSPSSQEQRTYEKLQVPPPSLCFDCRMQRKMTFRNERTLYNRSCDLCHKKIVSMYDEGAPFPVFCVPCWWGDRWDGKQYAQPFNPTRPFFSQLLELQNKVPHLALMGVHNENSPYVNWVDECANCYMIFSSTDCEDTYYSELTVHCRSCVDCTNVTKSDECYFCIDVHQSYGVQFSRNIRNCRDVAFSFDLVGCHDCLFSYNQRHQQYLIGNVQYTPAKFQQARSKIFADRASLQAAWDKFIQLMRQDAIHKFANNTKSEEVEGDGLHASSRTYNSFDSSNIEDCVNIIYGVDVKDCADSFAIVNGSEECYEAFSHTGVRRGLFSIGTWYDSYDVQYSYSCVSSQHLFGCVGLKKSQYCLLNKQYSESEYQQLRQQVRTNMMRGDSADEKYGEFFAVTMSPFAYNETIAAENYQLTKEEVLARGWRWKETAPRTYQSGGNAPSAVSEQATSADFPSLTVSVLTCASCQKNYKLIPQELTFYQRHSLPIPLDCFQCRHAKRLSLRNPWKLWPRPCNCSITTHSNHQAAFCNETFKTTYAPTRPEKVFGDKCYQLEVY